MMLLLVLLVSSAHSSPFSSDCPNGISPREALRCSEQLTSYGDKIKNLEEGDLLKPETTQTMRSACSVFRNCYTRQKLCSLYEADVADQMESSCELYEILSRDRNRQCSQTIEKANANSLQCFNSVVDIILEGEKVGSQECDVFWSRIQCASQEVHALCSRTSADELERFIYKKGQERNC